METESIASVSQPVPPTSSTSPTPPLRPPLPQQTPKSGWSKFLHGVGYASSGLWYTLRTQPNMRVHLGIALLALVLGIVLRISSVEFAIIFVMISVVSCAEMFNTAFESCVDLASPEYHPLAKIAKDVAAGAVLLAALLAVIVGFFIFVPHLWVLIFQ